MGKNDLAMASLSQNVQERLLNDRSDSSTTGDELDKDEWLQDIRSAHTDRARRLRITQYFCLALFTTLIIFILSLVRAGHASRRLLELGPVDREGSPQPPAWESFPFLNGYFGGIRNMVPAADNVPEYPENWNFATEGPTGSSDTVGKAGSAIPEDIFDPYEDDSARRECFLDDTKRIQLPRTRYRRGKPQGMPNPIVGSAVEMGLRDDICFDRYGRFGPYGLRNIQDEDGAEKFPDIDYDKVQWSTAQQNCFIKNQHRFANAEQSANSHLFQRANLSQPENVAGFINSTQDHAANSPTKLPRNAVLIRTWSTHIYSLEDILYFRSLISELSLLSGGQYTIHFLVHVKDNDIPIWADKKIYDRTLQNALPSEFRGMGTLWSERQMNLIYGGLDEAHVRDLGIYGVYRGLILALQYFSHQHPEYDFIWHWELDVRYTGHWYHLFDRLNQWSKAQPRKLLWERSGRFYIPSVHGSWEDYKQMVRVQSEMGTKSASNVWAGLEKKPGGETGIPSNGGLERPIWGPAGPDDMLSNQDDPVPPTSSEKDHYEWGVGEDADLITFSPLFDPDNTMWFWRDDVVGYNRTGSMPRRRVAMGTNSRLSRRLLRTMHRETILARHHMFSEMWSASVALHHGYKAVYAPHPIYVDRAWPPQYLADVFNGGRNGATGGARTSVFGGGEHNLVGQSWFYNSGFAPNLWRRWLGLNVDSDDGEGTAREPDGRMCLPGILFHPVKDVELPGGSNDVDKGESHAPKRS